MLKYIYALIFIFSFNAAFAEESSMAQFLQDAQQCQDSNCVQNNIDAIDAQIVALLGKRLAFVQQGARLQGSGVVPVSNSQQNTTLAKVAQAAKIVGYPPMVARVVFGTILMQSNVYAQQFNR